MSKYHLLAAQLKLPEAANELKHALTHKEGSRYVFAGMFAFKGRVAEILYQYIPASGTALQHSLGNIFKNDHLNRLFTYYDLQHSIRHNPDFDAASHRHIFVYGLLGWLFVHADEETIQSFIRRHFILPYSHLLIPENKSADLTAQCNVYAKILHNHTVTLDTQKTGEQWTTTVVAGEILLSRETSAGYQYSRKKALKNALIALTEMANRADSQTPGYELRRQSLDDALQKKQEAEKQRKARAYAEKQQQKKIDSAKRKADRKARALETDIKRRKAKLAAKQRKEQQQRQAAQQEAKMSNMSANKRRHLQDKGQL